MPSSLPIPPGSALPAPWGLFEPLLLVTFAAHLLVMNAALGGSLIAFLTPGPGRGAATSLGGRLPTAVAVTVNLGVPPLLFASVLYGQYLYTAAILSAVAWMSFFLVVMAAYAFLYYAQPRLSAPGSGVFLVPPVLLLLLASLVMVNASTLAIRPGAWDGWFGHETGTFFNFGDPTFFPRWLHFLVASLAVGGLFLALIHRRAAGRGDAEAGARMRLGLWWFTRATMVQLADGLVFLFTLPAAARGLFLGGSLPHTALLALAAGLGLAALFQGLRGAPGRAALFVVATVLGMVTVRELVRQALLAPEFSPASLAVLPQYGPLAMFLASLAGVAGVTVWILGVWRRPAGRG
ncbi:hypothetical protein DFW101_1792 [Solidesulfovibrio carbinoliphilus subsp. oakridgensis]|uniref:Uncharacterized protein n=1 Tax=Solidesulfovibrio carbinoliphilus subsp. oakridgensis TaxID=694327 RepID=G7Q977_9BACT|nr:hypothetical protein [Solidesulfovibrio carbinoliphilus]EHJ47799.1 hypothetical protein DFW101_1792 [Solidesulfovibrio carbinoliphilus subsp. oakridgensis]